MLQKSSLVARLVVLRDELDSLIKASEQEALENFHIVSTMHEIAERTAIETGVSVEQMQGRRRGKDINRARKIAMYRMYVTGRFSAAEIGNFFDGRDHSTVLHAIKNLER